MCLNGGHGCTYLSLGELKPAHLQLNSTEEGAEESDHAQELHSAQVSDDVLLTDVGDAVQRCSAKD